MSHSSLAVNIIHLTLFVILKWPAVRAPALLFLWSCCRLGCWFANISGRIAIKIIIIIVVAVLDSFKLGRRRSLKLLNWFEGYSLRGHLSFHQQPKRQNISSSDYCLNLLTKPMNLLAMKLFVVIYSRLLMMKQAKKQMHQL